jgi:hypothetical protein
MKNTQHEGKDKLQASNVGRKRINIENVQHKG